VKSVIGRYDTFCHRIESEDAAGGLVEFASGAWALVLTTTCSFPDLGTTLEVTGARGTVAWHNSKLHVFQAMKGDVSGVPEWGTPEAEDLNLDDFPAPEDLPPHIIADMVQAITERKPVQCDGHEGRKSVALFQAIYESCEQGKAVPPP
jgi:UDP-N-acetyl-2-amino-2-deoxyglucuronate dehydrogenase